MLRRLPAALALGLVLACASPTLPLPPPAAPVQQMVDATDVHLSYGCGGVEGGASVTVMNQTESNPATHDFGVVAIASACGAWDALIYAQTNDHLVVTYTVGTDTSLPARVIVGAP
jgi:hypothetical protein